jgi:hypothetical protein
VSESLDDLSLGGDEYDQDRQGRGIPIEGICLGISEGNMPARSKQLICFI